MSMGQTEVVQRAAAAAGYGGASLFAGLTLADIDLLLRIAVGAISFVSIAVHLFFKIRAERRGSKRRAK